MERVYEYLQFIYWKMCYEKKCSKILNRIPIVIIAIGSIVFLGNGIFVNRTMELILFILIMFELIYNYRKWKNDKE